MNIVASIERHIHLSSLLLLFWLRVCVYVKNYTRISFLSFISFLYEEKFRLTLFTRAAHVPNFFVFQFVYFTRPEKIRNKFQLQLEITWVVSTLPAQTMNLDISRTTLGIAAGIAGTLFLSYCIYFDKKRRSDPEYKRKVRERKYWWINLNGGKQIM